MDELKQRILIIDADTSHSLDLSQFLQGCGYLARTASEKNEAVSIIQSWNPDLVILDILIRSFNAMSLLDELKNNPATEKQKVLILSQPSGIDHVTGPTPIVSGYLTKPVDFESLKELLRIYAGVSGPNAKIPVMIADDDAEFAELLKIFLETNYYRPILAFDGNNAIEKAKKERPSAILLDLMMPGKDGFEVIEELQREPSTSHISIIALSAMRLNAYQNRGIMTGEPEIISKRVEKDFLLETIRQRLKGEIGIKNSSAPKAKSRILLADDQPDLLALMQETLEKAGFEVTVASDGGEALEKIYSENPDIAVLDYNMPVKDGLAITRTLKDDPLFAHLPVIILTAVSEKESKMRGLNLGVDDYLIKPVDTDELIARIKMILHRTKQVLDSNPLSKLPGNPSIQARIEREVARNIKFAVLYLDLNQFKAYNDCYGFDAGDRVIRATANLIVKLTRQNGGEKDFIGHIGGDDFIVVTDVERAEELCKKIISGFDAIVPAFYNEEDRKQGHIISTDRQGVIKHFPFLSIAIGIVHNKFRPLENIGQIGEIGSELKKHAKSFPNSCYVVDKRRD